MIVREVTECRVCGTHLPPPFFDMGEQALANAFQKIDEPARELRFPLAVTCCPCCFLVQLTVAVDPSVLFPPDYPYLSSDSPQVASHFRRYAVDILHRFPVQSNGFVVEIGSNDGFLLSRFREVGARVLGVDPAESAATRARTIKVETKTRFFDKDAVAEIVSEYGRANLIVANNVLAHAESPTDILDAAHNLLSDDGILVVEVQYLGDMLAHGDFTNIYHEHGCYFSMKSLNFLLNTCGFKPFIVEKIDAHGGSLRVFARLIDECSNIRFCGGLQEDEYDFEHFSRKAYSVRDKVLALIDPYRGRIFGYGASAKGSVLLQFCGLGKDDVVYVADDAATKHMHLTPGTHIPIVPPVRLRGSSRDGDFNQPTCILLTAWNYAESIIERERWLLGQGCSFVVPLPETKVVKA